MDGEKVAGLFIRQPGGKFYARLTINGKRTFRKLQSTKIRAAAKECKELQLGFVRSVSTRGIETLHAAMAQTMEFRKVRKINRSLKQRSIEYNEEILQTAKKIFPDVPLAHITEQGALTMMSKFKAGASRKRAVLQLLKGTLAKAVETGAISSNPLAGYIAQQTEIKKRELPTREQLDQLIEVMPELYPKSGKSVALSIRFLAFSGMRIHEANKVTWSDYKNGKIKISDDTKTGSRFLDVNPPLQKTLEDIAEVLGNNPQKPIMPCLRIREQLQKGCDHLGMAKLDHHDLRAWFITWCINSGIDVKTIADWSGNSPNVLLTRYASIQETKKIESALKLS